MNKLSLTDLSVDQLVDKFVQIAIAQDKAELMDEIEEYNRLYLQMEAVEEALKAKYGDARSALLSLYGHSNMQVRLKAAKATLAVAPQAARDALKAIANSKWYPQAGDAGMCLIALDDGIFIPS
jgi:hypothetical protein